MNTLKRIFLLLVLSTLVAAPGLAQTALTTTTTSEVVDAEETIIDIASISGVVVGDYAVVDKEAMQVVSIGTASITVVRGVAGTLSDDHATAADIFIDPPSFFASSDPSGPCTAGSEYPNYEPYINPTSGNRFRCLEGRWAMVWNGDANFGEQFVTWAQGGTVADAIDTIFFVAPRALRVTDIDAIWDTAETTGSMNIQVQKLVGTEAITAGDDLLSSVIDATGVANTTANGTLSATASVLELAAGDKLAMELTATPDEVVGMTVTVRLVPDSN